MKNKIKQLDHLPNSLQKLKCDHNQIKQLDHLPNSLQILYCYNNQIKELDQVKKKEIEDKKKIFDENLLKAEEKVKCVEEKTFETWDEAKKVVEEAQAFLSSLEIRKHDHALFCEIE